MSIFFILIVRLPSLPKYNKVFFCRIQRKVLDIHWKCTSSILFDLYFIRKMKIKGEKSYRIYLEPFITIFTVILKISYYILKLAFNIITKQINIFHFNLCFKIRLIIRKIKTLKNLFTIMITLRIKQNHLYYRF